jgi:circadian clock protein KaiB
MGKAAFVTDQVRFRLYITENAPHSNKAIVNLKELLRQLDLNNYQLEILDIHKHSHLAIADKILVSPTLLKLSAKSAIRLVGDLSNPQMVKRKLELE